MGADGQVALGGFQPALPGSGRATINPSRRFCGHGGVGAASGLGSSLMSSGRATQACHAKWGGPDGGGQDPGWARGMVGLKCGSRTWTGLAGVLMSTWCPRRPSEQGLVDLVHFRVFVPGGIELAVPGISAL